MAGQPGPQIGPNDTRGGNVPQANQELNSQILVTPLAEQQAAPLRRKEVHQVQKPLVSDPQAPGQTGALGEGVDGIGAPVVQLQRRKVEQLRDEELLNIDDRAPLPTDVSQLPTDNDVFLQQQKARVKSFL